jgi:SAM-dependent methyltransferase
VSERCSRVLRAVQDTIAAELRALRRESGRPLSLLDVGCWEGDATVRYRDALGGPARGVEVFAEQAAVARARGIEVAEVDLEAQPFPWAEGTVDVAVANQVFEHLKNVWLPIAEMARVVAPGGHLVFSVPNLASLHNRVLLALGRQPTSIRTFGPHVRGYTHRQVGEFLTLGGFLEIRRVVGVGFYPFPATLASPLARAWTGASHTPVFIARRVAPLGVIPPWTALFEEAREAGEQTWYG